MTENILPDEVKIRYEKAAMAVDKSNYDYAIELLTQVIKIKPDFAKGRQLLRLAQIKKFDSKNPNILNRMISRLLSYIPTIVAMINESNGNHHAAMAVYETILKQDPKNADIMVKLGNLLSLEGMREAAAVTLESAIGVSIKNITAYALLGEVYSKLGNYNRARFCFKKVLEMRPHDAAAERGLKNIDALTTIDKSFEKKDGGEFRMREIKE